MLLSSIGVCPFRLVIMNVEEALQGMWHQKLAAELQAEYMQSLAAFLRAEQSAGKRIYPPGRLMFRAMNLTPLEQVRCVLLGQDPYHGSGQAEGLCFSVPEGVARPPSLRNIFRELESDLGVTIPARCSSLVPWAEQGVLLLNSVLSVEEGKAASHQGKGWERFTDAILNVLSREERPMVFMLWGRYAQEKARHLHHPEHLVLQAAHPSPLSAGRGGFFGCRHFSRCNEFLRAHGQTPVDWLTIAGV